MPYLKLDNNSRTRGSPLINYGSYDSLDTQWQNNIDLSLLMIHLYDTPEKGRQ